MKAKPILESKKRNDTFVYSKVESENHGPVLKAENEKGKKFVIHASLDNLSRFKDWIGKEADTEYKLTGDKISTEDGKFPTIRIKVDSKSNEKVVRPTDSDDKVM